MDTPTEYAGKYVFIEHREKSDEVYIQTLTSEHYKNKGASHRPQSDYTGRIGDIYYLSNGYYNLIEHSYKCYESESELPKYRMESGLRSEEMLVNLREDELLARYLSDDDLYYADRYLILDNRIYVAFVIGNYIHDEPSGEHEEYEGSDLLVVMLDANTYEVLYAEKYHSTNYYLGTRNAAFTIDIYRKGEDGFLYDPYIVE